MSATPPRHGESASGSYSQPPNHSGATPRADSYIGEEAAGLLDESSGTRHHDSDFEERGTHDGNESSKIEGWRRLPWWKRPSPWWYVRLIPP
ncbi:hypothetical protein NMY22_g5979 [Coprinellus aureogranulatus]|nr:hypothetical protein NMY22_g5979 [Coprinellus aureogranulatus]